MSPDEIVSAYPTLILSDVHAALAYYDHQAEIDANIKEDDDHWAEIQRQHPGRLIDRLSLYRCGSAGNRAATMFTIIETAKLNGLDPEAYLRVPIVSIDDHPTKCIEELLPWNVTL